MGVITIGVALYQKFTFMKKVPKHAINYVRHQAAQKTKQIILNDFHFTPRVFDALINEMKNNKWYKVEFTDTVFKGKY